MIECNTLSYSFNAPLQMILGLPHDQSPSTTIDSYFTFDLLNFVYLMYFFNACVGGGGGGGLYTQHQS